MTNRVIKLSGNKIALCPLIQSDIPFLHRSISDLRVAKTTSAAQKIFTLEDERRWFKSVSGKNKKNKVLAIIVKKTGKLIGTIGLHNINTVHRRASLGIIIGDKQFWGRGLGREAVAVFIDFAFNVLNLHSVRLNVYSFNLRGIRSYKAVGFKEAGRLREAHFWGGKFYDIIKMDVLDKEFNNSRIKNLIFESQRS